MMALDSFTNDQYQSPNPNPTRAKTGQVIRKLQPPASRSIRRIQLTIMKTLMSTGASTGPNQGTGIRNRQSHSNMEPGHPEKTLKPI